MADFPYTSTLDEFARSDAITLGTSWAAVNGYSNLRVSSNQAAYQNRPAFEYYTTIYNGNQEAYASVKTTLATTNDIVFLGLRITSPTTSGVDGYRVEFRQLGSNIDAYLVRESTGVADTTAIDLGISEFTSGDKIGASAQGGTIRVYYYDSSAASPSWTEIGSWTGVAYQPASSYIGIGFKTSNTTWPTTVWAATQKNGVYTASDFTGANDATQPTWASDNTGLPDMSLSKNQLRRMTHDPAQYTRQAVLWRDTTNASSNDYSIYQRDNAGTWNSILTESEANTLVGSTDQRIYDITYNQNGDGVLYAIIANSNNLDKNVYLCKYEGSSWSVFATEEITAGVGVVLCRTLRVNGDEIVFYTSSSSRGWIYYSSNGGGEFSAQEILNADGVRPIDINLFERIVLIDDLTSDSYLVSKSGLSLSTIQDSKNLGPQKEDAHDYDNGDDNQQRLLVSSALWRTTDNWDTVVDASPSTISPQVDRLWHGYAFDDIFYSSDLEDTQNPHTVLVDDDPASTSPTGKSGDSPQTVPYTDSIPFNSGEIVKGGLVFQLESSVAFDDFGGGFDAVARQDAIHDDLIDIIDGIVDLGANVFGRMRWAVNRDDMLAFSMADVDGTNELRVFWIELAGVVDAAPDVFQTSGAATGFLRNYTYKVRGWIGLNDSEDTYADARDLATQIIDSLDASTTLHDGVGYYDCTRATLDIFEPRLYYGILSHHIEVSVTVSDWVA